MTALDLLSAAVAGDLLERTSSTARVQHVVQLSLAPAFLLAAIGAIMNVMMNRLIWVAGRIERIEQRNAEANTGSPEAELRALYRRRSLVRHAVMFSTAAAMTISLVIALLFISAFISPRIGTLIAGVWIVTVLLLIAGMLLFLLETRLAAKRLPRT